MPKLRGCLEWLSPLAQPVVGGQEEREASRYSNRMVSGWLPLDGAPCRDGCPQGIHRFRCPWQLTEDVHEKYRHGTLCHQLHSQIGELHLVWQVSKPEQMRDLLKRLCAGQVVDVVAAVQQLPCRFLDLAECRRSHDHPLEHSPTRFGCRSNCCVLLWIASCFWHRC